MNSSTKICYIAGAGNAEMVSFCPQNKDLVIAADGGFDLLDRLKIKPDFLIGDFDSIRDVPPISSFAIRYPEEKDDTDMMLAIKFALERGCKTFVIYGGLGNRLDHTLANIQGLAYLSMQGAQGYLVGMGSVITAITNRSMALAARKSGILSVFSHNRNALGVTLSGLKYELRDAELTNDRPLGVSNQFIGKESIISVRDGTLIIIWQEENFSLPTDSELI